jgi:hypothetical protein
MKVDVPLTDLNGGPVLDRPPVPDGDTAPRAVLLSDVLAAALQVTLPEMTVEEKELNFELARRIVSGEDVQLTMAEVSAIRRAGRQMSVLAWGRLVGIEKKLRKNEED